MIRAAVFYPELVLTGTGVLLLLVDLFRRKGAPAGPLYVLAAAGTAAAGAPILVYPSWMAGETFNGFLRADAFALFLKAVVVLGTLLTLLMIRRYFTAVETSYPAEFLAILMFSAAGAAVVASARELLTLYIGLETLTISSYLLAAYLKRSTGSHEAGLKYLLLGAFSSALLLFGFSYLYGLTGTTYIPDVAERLARSEAGLLGFFAVALVAAGLAFKISAAPFHMWTPDVYEGCPTPLTAYLSVVSKAAGFAAFARIFLEGLSNPALAHGWTVLFAGLAALSMVWGNLAAIPQEGLKRMLAYSTIGQAGYLLLGLVAVDLLGATALLYYLLLYLFANLGAFLAVVVASAHTGSDRIEDVAGLAARSPLLAATLLVTFLSLAGVPPFAGFLGKWYLFSAAVRQGHVWLVVLGILFSVVSLYYYLQVVKQAYIRPASDGTPIRTTPLESAALLACAAFTVMLGIWPKHFMAWAETAARSLFP